MPLRATLDQIGEIQRVLGSDDHEADRAAYEIWAYVRDQVLEATAHDELMAALTSVVEMLEEADKYGGEVVLGEEGWRKVDAARALLARLKEGEP